METIDVSAVKLAFESASTWSEWSTIAVAVGVFVELVALFVFSKEMPHLEKKVLVMATALIVIGCAGEFVFGSRASNAASQLQQASDQKIAILTKDTARLSADAEAERKAAAKTEERVALAEKSAADARERAAKSELALEEFKAHRKLKQPQSIIDKLTPFSGVPFEVGIQTEAEPIDLMGQMTAVLKAAGWVWKDAEGTVFFNVPGDPRMALIVLSGGVQIKIAKSRVAEWGAAVGALTDALKDDGITAFAYATEDTPAATIHVDIGTK
jgi:hypothetical protein